MSRFLEVFREFITLGLTAFGGPTAHVAFFENRFVAEKKWLTASEFADLLALCQFLPGPGSSQLGLAIGWKRSGIPGAVAAWTGFTLPSAIVLILFGISVLKFGGEALDSDAGWLRGLQIAVVIVIAKALVSMWKMLCPDRRRRLIALVAAGVILATGLAWMQIVVIAVGAILGMLFVKTDPIGSGERPNPVASDSSSRESARGGAIACLVSFFLLLLGMPFLVAAFPGNPALEVFAAMYRSGALVFGGGHVVLPLLSDEVVTTGWISEEAFLAGYGAAQAVPGPLFTFSAYLGSIVAGPGGPWAMGAIALVGIFLPAWLLVLGVMPFWESVSQRPILRRALAGTNAAVVGLLGAALYTPVWTGAIESARDVVFLLGVAAALLVVRLPVWLVVILAGVVGALVLG